MSKASEAKKLRELKAASKLWEKILSTPYSYKNNTDKLSYDEEVLINLTCKELEGKDGEIGKAKMKSLWGKIKKKMKTDLRKGNHKSKLFQMCFQWNIKQKYFAELLVKEKGDFLRLLDMYRTRFGMMPTEEEAELMFKTCLNRFQEY